MHTDWDQLPYEEPEIVRVAISELFPEWQWDAKCASEDPDTFFGPEPPPSLDTEDKERRSMSPRMIRRAAAICDDCPVFSQCLRYSLENDEQYGVWAGTSGRVRQRIQRMLVFNVVTIDEVVEDYSHGRRSRYEGQEEKRDIDDDITRRRRMRVAAQREVARMDSRPNAV